MKTHCLLLVSCCLLVISNFAFAAAPSFRGIGDLAGGRFESDARDISGDGSVVVGYSSSSISNYQAFRWTAETGMVGLGGFFDSMGSSVSGDGSVVAGPVPLSGGFSNPKAWAVSADGSSIAGEGSSRYGTQAFRWTAEGGMTGLGTLGDSYYFSTAYGISGDGSVVAGYSWSTLGPQAFRWTASTGMVGIGDLPGGDFESWALDVSANGSVIIGYSDGAAGAEAFRWTAETGMVGLGVPATRARATSADGSVIVGGHNGDAFYWTTSGGVQSIREMLISSGVNLNGWSLVEASGVSADGLTITGTGINPQGFNESWVATVPEPATIGLLAMGGILLRRKR